MTEYGHIAAKLFQMDERAWERHASPWSVWTRVASLPLLLAAVWSHVWLGIWALVPVALVVLWLWLNAPVPGSCHKERLECKGDLRGTCLAQSKGRPDP
nr:DUF6653 family protein [Microvirga tunisiensis]